MSIPTQLELLLEIVCYGLVPYQFSSLEILIIVDSFPKSAMTERCSLVESSYHGGGVETVQKIGYQFKVLFWRLETQKRWVNIPWLGLNSNVNKKQLNRVNVIAGPDGISR